MTLIFVSSNIHKFQEIQKILNEHDIQVSFHQEELPELQSSSLEKIALFSAKHAFSQLQQPLFVEDTGLFIQSLNEFPGPYSSFVFKTIGNQGILRLLKDKPNRNAVFRTAIVLISPKTEPISFIGETQGTIAFKEQGNQGWGYDPIFIPLEGDGRTYGQMQLSEKNHISHRRKSIEKLIAYLPGNI